MGCSNCKKKNTYLDEKEKQMSGVNNAVIGFVIIWSLLALYGLYSLIMLLV